MKPMKLADIKAHTGRDMSYAEAVTISNPGFGCKQQAIALSLHTWHNTPEDWLRLQACVVILANKRCANVR